MSRRQLTLGGVALLWLVPGCNKPADRKGEEAQVTKVVTAFMSSRSLSARLAHCTPRFQAVLKAGVFSGPDSFALRGVRVGGDDALADLTVKRNGKASALQLRLSRTSGWKIDDILVQMGSKAVSISRLVAVLGPPKGERSLPLGRKSLRGMTLELAKPRKQPPNSLALTVQYESDRRVELKEKQVKGLSPFSVVQFGRRFTLSFSKPAKLPFKTDVRLVFVKEFADLVGTECVVLPKTPNNVVHRFAPTAKKLQMGQFARFEQQGRVDLMSFGPADKRRSVKVGETTVYLMSPKEKSARVSRMLVATGILKGASTSKVGELKLFVGGAGVWAKFKLTQKGGDVGFVVYTSPRFDSSMPKSFSSFKICYTPYLPANYFEFLFKDLTIP